MQPHAGSCRQGRHLLRTLLLRQIRIASRHRLRDRHRGLHASPCRAIRPPVMLTHLRLAVHEEQLPAATAEQPG